MTVSDHKLSRAEGPGVPAETGASTRTDVAAPTASGESAVPRESPPVGMSPRTDEPTASGESAAHTSETAHIGTPTHTSKTVHPRRKPVPVLTVLASGSGTTFQAVVDAVAAGELPWRVNLLAVDRPGTGAAERAAAAGIPVRLVDRAEYRGSAQGSAQGAARSHGLSQALSRAIPEETDLVLLAGFLSIIEEPLLTRFHRRMINLHPALLPEFGGAGMYGRRVHEAVLAAGRRQTGCTVHYVDAGTDTGEILLHRRIPVFPEDTPDSLARRLRPVEHRAVIDVLLTLAPEVR